MATHDTKQGRDVSQNPNSSSLDRIHHVAVMVPNITEAVSWYTTTFRCTIEYSDDTWALLDFANTKLALVLPHQHPPHFAVARHDAKKFGTLTTHRDGLKSIYVKDVAGNPLEILQDDTTESTAS